jgi:hypothetical protein
MRVKRLTTTFIAVLFNPFGVASSFLIHSPPISSAAIQIESLQDSNELLQFLFNPFRVASLFGSFLADFVSGCSN